MASSRESMAGAGWACRTPGTYRERMPPNRRGPFSWFQPRTLWRSRNDTLAKVVDDPTNDARRRWMAGRPADPVIDRSELERFRCILLGDPGEGDASQYSLVPGLLQRAQGAAFMVVCSDVIYPAGDIADYDDHFASAYAELPLPIHAIPGNHDWYDGLEGFMRWFCDARPVEGAPRPTALSRGWLRHLLWRRPSEVDEAALAVARSRRAGGTEWATQPAPYFALETGPVRFVAIDTGITNVLDRDQAAWLRRVSRDSEKPKVLLTGKPLYVDNQRREGALEDGGTVLDIVRDPAHRYVAAIGGDVHNYQRYPVGGIQYVVSGGGGAFMHATHEIGVVDVDGCTEDEFKCYPLRGDSLSRYSALYAKKPIVGLGMQPIPAEEAAWIMAERLEMDPTRPGAREPSRASRRAARRMLGLPGRGRGPLHKLFSEWLDWDEPPFFKSFLELDVSPERIEITCRSATGCGEHELEPPVEDRFAIALPN